MHYNGVPWSGSDTKLLWKLVVVPHCRQTRCKIAFSFQFTTLTEYMGAGRFGAV